MPDTGLSIPYASSPRVLFYFHTHFAEEEAGAYGDEVNVPKLLSGRTGTLSWAVCLQGPCSQTPH